MAGHALHFCVDAFAVFAVAHSPHGVRLTTNARHFHFALFAIMATQAGGVIQARLYGSHNRFGCSRSRSRYIENGGKQAYDKSQEPKGETMGAHYLFVPTAS